MEQHELKNRRNPKVMQFLLVNTNALVLVPLSSYHDISFIENKDLNFAQIKASELGSPIQYFPGSTDKNMLGQLRSSRDCGHHQNKSWKNDWIFNN